MALGKSAAVVVGAFPLGESDQIVTFFSREYGKLRGVAKASRRMRSRFAGALQLFTRGQLVFFDTGRSELVRIDHFDIVEPFGRIRDDLERLGQASWIVECVSRLTAERDPHVALYGLLTRSLRAVASDVAPVRVARGGGGHVAQHHVGRPAQLGAQQVRRVVGHEIVVQDLGAGNRIDGGDVDADHLPGGEPLREAARDTARSTAHVEQAHAGSQMRQEEGRRLVGGALRVLLEGRRRVAMRVVLVTNGAISHVPLVEIRARARP